MINVNQANKDIAKDLRHKESVIALYEILKEQTAHYSTNQISELDIIYFLRNILWSTNFELIAAIIRDYGMECRLDQWKEQIEQLDIATKEKMSNNA